MAEDRHAPSAERRRKLKALEAQSNHSLVRVLDECPIDKYYKMTEQLLLAFHRSVDERRLDDAYIFGLRFATFSVEALPKHKSFALASYKRQRLKNARQVDDVLQKMESVASRMDAEELLLVRKRQEEEESRQKEEQQRREEENARRLEEENREKRHAQILQQQRQELEAQRKAEKEIKDIEKREELERRAREKLKTLGTKSERSVQSTNNSTDGKETTKEQPKVSSERLLDNKKSDSQSSVNVDSLRKKLNALSNPAKTKPATGNITEPKKPKHDQPKAKHENEYRRKQAMQEEDTVQDNFEIEIGEDGKTPVVKPSSSRKMTAKEPESTTTSNDNLLQEKEEEQPSPYRCKMLTKQEARTFRLLQETLKQQEKRLTMMEESDDRAMLRQEAKQRIKNGDRKGALFCLAKKRRINHTIEMVKQAIFNMETQILMLESAVEDREVSRLMEAASGEMDALQKNIHVDADSFASSDNVGHGVMGDIVFDEEELLSELQDQEPEGEKMADDDDQSLLTLPSLPEGGLVDSQNKQKEQKSEKLVQPLAQLF